ncbi:hypothetical protein PC119_g26684, partial [Phytophthora cactorum]
MYETRSHMEAKSTQEKEYGVAQPIFTPVLPPAITSTSHAALVKWRKERKVYEDTMRARCQTSGEDYQAIAVEDVEDDRLRNEIDSIINSVKNRTL